MITVSRMCLVTAAYQLIWGGAMYFQGAQLPAMELGEIFPPEILLENPIVNHWIRLLGATVFAIGVLNYILSKVKSFEAQELIRKGSLCFWCTEFVIDSLGTQLPAYLQGEPQITTTMIATASISRILLISLWFVSKPIVHGPATTSSSS